MHTLHRDQRQNQTLEHTKAEGQEKTKTNQAAKSQRSARRPCVDMHLV